MLFETTVPIPPDIERTKYRYHQLVANIFAANDRDFNWGEERDFIWTETDGILYLRRCIPTNNLAWKPVQVPPEQSVITLRVEVRARSSRGDKRRATHKLERAGAPPRVRRGTRRGYVEPNEAIAWLERTGPKIGLQIEDAEVEIEPQFIESRNHRRFKVTGTNFTAVATVTNPKSFEIALTKGVGDSKAFGFGFIHFWQRGQHAY